MKQQLQNNMILKKSFAVMCYVISFASLIILIKTELRKWFSFGGDPSSANSAIFWGSLILFSLFLFLGNKIWPSTEEKKIEIKKDN